MLIMAVFGMLIARHDSHERQRGRSYVEFPFFHNLHVIQVERNDVLVSTIRKEQSLTYDDQAWGTIEARAGIDGLRQLCFADNVAIGGINRVQHAVVGERVEHLAMAAVSTSHGVFAFGRGKNLGHFLLFRGDHPKTRVLEPRCGYRHSISEEVLRIMVPPQGADAARLGHPLTVLDEPVVEVIIMWFDEQDTIDTAVSRTVMIVRFAVHPRACFPTLVPDDFIIEIPDFDTDRQDILRIRIRHSHREKIVLEGYHRTMLWTGVEIGDFVRVSLFLDLVLIHQRNYTRGVVEDRRPLPTVREVDRKLFVDGQPHLAHRHHNQIFVIPMRH